MVTGEQARQKSRIMMGALLTVLPVGSVLTVNGRDCTITDVTESLFFAVGKRGANKVITPRLNARVLGKPDAMVYSLVANSKSEDFFLLDGTIHSL